MQCAIHPKTETLLRCSKCEKPICPKCLHYTPVGVRCRECANLKRLPQYELSIAYVARGLGAALVVGAVAGAIWGVIPFGILGLLVGGGAGYMIGESVSIATNRKVGVQVQVLAGAGVVLAFVVRGAILASSLRGWDIEFILLRDLFGYLALALAMVVAVGRLR